MIHLYNNLGKWNTGDTVQNIKNTFHGWNIYWLGKFDNLSKGEFNQAICLHFDATVPHELVLEFFGIHGLQMSWLGGMTDFWQEGRSGAVLDTKIRLTFYHSSGFCQCIPFIPCWKETKSQRWTCFENYTSMVLAKGAVECSCLTKRNSVFYFFKLARVEILKITFTFVEVGAWVILAYYVNGFDPMLEGCLRSTFFLYLKAKRLLIFSIIAAASLVVAKRFGSLTNLLLSHWWLHPVKRKWRILVY